MQRIESALGPFLPNGSEAHRPLSVAFAQAPGPSIIATYTPVAVMMIRAYEQRCGNSMFGVGGVLLVRVDWW